MLNYKWRFDFKTLDYLTEKLGYEKKLCFLFLSEACVQLIANRRPLRRQIMVQVLMKL